MIIVNINIRGLGGGVKAKYLKHIICKKGVNLCVFKRPKLRSFLIVDVLLCEGIIKLVGCIAKERMGQKAFFLCGTKKCLNIAPMSKEEVS